MGSRGEAGVPVLEGLFKPKSVAVVGVARSEGKVGHFIFDNLLHAGFEGPVYPVNPHAEEIHGHRCYPSVADLPAVVDLAIIVVPAEHVAPVVEACGVSGVPAAIVISAGFKESGPAGAALEREVVRIASEYGMRILGPNCLGVLSTPSHLNASFSASMPPQGGISFLSQSGALGTAILDWAEGVGLGLAHFVSLGNRADISETDLLEAWCDDSETRVVVAYLESVADGSAFVDAAQRVSRSKPIIAVKSGGSDAGARAVSSHTGSLAGTDVAYEAAFRRSGVIRARSVEQLFDFAAAFAGQPVPTGDGLAIVTNAGGPAVMATDACERAGIGLASFEQETIDALRAVLPAAAAFYNPVDILGDASAQRYAAALQAIYADPNVRSVLCVLTPQAMTESAMTAAALADIAGPSKITTLASFMGGSGVSDAIRTLASSAIPNFSFPERAVASIGAMRSYSRYLDRPEPRHDPVHADRERVRSIIDDARRSGRSYITAEDAAAIVAAYGVPTPRGAVGRDLAAVRALAAEIGYPVAAKISSPDLLHKSDVGGIRIGIEDEAQLESAYDDLLGKARSYAPDAVIEGLQIQEMVAPGREVIVGVDRDQQFGPLLMFGLGGVYVEVLKDVTFQLCPIDQQQAREMLSEIRGYGLLRGVRGERPADIEAIAECIVRVSALVTDFPEILELDINPLIVAEAGSGALAADVRIGIGGAS
jgi:acetyltransferase